MKVSSQSWKKIKAIVLALGMMLILTGCDIPATLQNGLSVAFSGRAEQNKDIATKLYRSGLLREDTYNQIINDIDTKLTNLPKQLGDGAHDEDMTNLLKSCVGWNLAREKDHQDHVKDCKGGNCGCPWHHGGSSPAGDINEARFNHKSENTSKDPHGRAQCDTFVGGFITNWLTTKESDGWTFLHIANNRIIRNNVPCIRGDGAPIKPIEVISESLVKDINEQLSVEVYALKSNVTEEGYGLDQVMEAVTQAANESDAKKAEAILSNYFSAVTYIDKEDGNKEKPVTLMDENDPEQQIVRITTHDYDEAYEDEELLTFYDGIAGLHYIGQTNWCHYDPDHDDNFPDPSLGNQCGIDFTLKMGDYNQLAIRLIEFNQRAVDKISAYVGFGQDRYLVLNGHAYLMEYPIGYIDKFVESEDRTSYNSSISRSQLGFNIKTGNFSKYKTDEDGNLTNDSVVISSDDPYLTYSGALNNTATPQASLILYGETGITKDGEEVDPLNKPWDLKIGGMTKDGLRTASVGRIVLRDYLEATYAPGVVGDDSLIVLGRKLRIENLNGSKSNPVAKFYDKDGLELDGSPTLYIQDFADIPGLYASPQKVRYISGYQEDTGDVDEGTSGDTGDGTAGDDGEDSGDENTGDESDDTGEVLKNTLSKVDSIPKEIVSEIQVSTKFPGEKIGNSDYNEEDNKPLFYTMFVRASMFQTGLFSGWVQSTDTTKNSTVWWNDWLTAHGYQYRINTDNLVNYLKGNYAYDLAQKGIIILDLETIAKIQQDFNRDSQIETSHWMRTVFMIFGYILIGYAVIMLIAWNVDVNVDLGFNILEKLSFGKWVAIKDYDEMPYMNTTETNFVKFSELLISCIIIISIGLVLILVNVVDLILMIIQLFGGLASYISKMITGV